MTVTHKSNWKLLSHFFNHLHTYIQLKFYAMFNNPDDIRIDDNSLGTAVCEDEREIEYDGSTVRVFMSCNVVFSFFCVIFLLPMMVGSVCSKIDAAINKEQNHANLAAFVLTGLVFSTFVVVLDIIALVLIAEGKHEFSRHSNVSSLTFVIITAVFDAIAVLIAYIILIYLGLSKRIQEKILKCGEKIVAACCKKIVEDEQSWNLWIVASMCFAPLFCIASHSGYIIVAWVSDTQHAGPVTSFYLISFLYYFIIFRQLYKFFSKVKPTSCPLLCCCSYLFSCCSYLFSCCSYLFCCCCSKKDDEEGGGGGEEGGEGGGGGEEGGGEEGGEGGGGEEEEGGEEGGGEGKGNVSTFNVSAFFIVTSLALIPVGMEIYMIYSLKALPAIVSAAPTGVYHIVQLAFIVITGLFTYKLFYTEDEPKQFAKAFVENFKTANIQDKMLVKDAHYIEASGKILGGVAFRIMQQNTSQGSTDQKQRNSNEGSPLFVTPM